jgi:hypothetical protein
MTENIRLPHCAFRKMYAVTLIQITPFFGDAFYGEEFSIFSASLKIAKAGLLKLLS